MNKKNKTYTSKNHQQQENLSSKEKYNIILKALENLNKGNLKVAAQLIETAFHADNDNDQMHDARAKIYREFSLKQSSSMGRNILNHASMASAQGKRDLAQTED